MRYPFPSKAEILNSIDSSYAFAADCLLVIDGRQTFDEHLDRVTRYVNVRGFMSSHAAVGAKLADKIRSKEELTVEEQGRVVAMSRRYSRQLACHFRAQMIEANPDLAAVASKFSAA